MFEIQRSWAGAEKKERKERRSSLRLFDTRMGKRTVRSQAHLHEEVPEAGIHQALTLPGSLSGRELADACFGCPLCQSQESHDCPFLANLPGLHGKEADNYPSGEKKIKGKKKKISSAS